MISAIASPRTLNVRSSGSLPVAGKSRAESLQGAFQPAQHAFPSRQAHFAGDTLEEGLDSFSLLSSSGEVDPQPSEDFLTKMKESRKEMAPVLAELNQIVVASHFPLEHKIRGPQGDCTSTPLGDFIQKQPEFDVMLLRDPQALQYGLKQLVGLSRVLERLPASWELRKQNAYVYRHLSNHMLNHALQKLWANPGQMESVGQGLLTSMAQANRKALLDPELKVEERMLRSIEAHDVKVGYLRQALDLLQERQMIEFVSSDKLEPDSASPPLVRNTRAHLHAIATEPSAEARAEALRVLDEKERQLSGLMGMQQERLKASHSIYTALSDLLRHKVTSVFSEPFPSHPTHPLKDMPGFPELWEACGGCRENVRPQP